VQQREEAERVSVSEESWLRAAKIMDEQIPPLLAQLEEDFQDLLGVTTAGECDDKKQQSTTG